MAARDKAKLQQLMDATCLGSCRRWIAPPSRVDNLPPTPEMLVTALVLLSFLCLLGIYNFIRKLRLENLAKREAVLKSLGASGTKRVVGYFHPYWYVAHSSCWPSPFCVFGASDLTKALPSNAGGGGERVLWTAIAHVQATEPDLVNVVYSGDFDATKEDIIQKVKVSSLLKLTRVGSSPSTPSQGSL